MLKCDCGWQGTELIPNEKTNTAHCPDCNAPFAGISAIYAKLAKFEVVEDDFEPHDKYKGKAPHDVRGWQPK